ncbi:hypothetical protein D1P53_002031 [Cryptococcus gattii VGV]|nr:hypothetical protein D1P53_002031 [Cryptococcus gattii VGV]
MRKSTSSSPPVAGESFWRWSHKASMASSDFSPPPSTIDTYAPTELHFAASHFPKYGEGRPMEAKSAHYSGSSAGSIIPDVNDLALSLTISKRGPSVVQNQVADGGLTSIPEASSSANSQEQQGIAHSQSCPTLLLDILDKHHKRSSAGTFGSKDSKYPSIYSMTSSNIAPERRMTSNIFDTTPAANQTTRRPSSYSSTSTSPQQSAIPKTVDDAAAVAMRPSMGMTSPCDIVGHRKPESESQIEDYLKKQSEGNRRRIAPTSSPVSTLDFGFESAKNLYDDLEDKMKMKKKDFRKSNVDQMLGEGAEHVRMTMEINRTTLQKALTGTVKQASNGPVPPPRNHKHFPSAATNSLHTFSPTKSTNSVRQEFTYAEALISPATTNFPASHSHKLPLGRSASIDSLPSLHPSLAESVNLERRPLLKYSLSPLPTQHHPSRSTISISHPSLPPPFPATNPALSMGSSLNPSQRTILIRRTRKLEALLGEPLPESQISQHVIDPLNSVKQFDTHVNEGWPDSPTAGWRRRVPEWEREDCLVQRVKGESDEEGGGKVKGNKSLAQKALEALNLAGRRPEGEHLKVYVSRQMRVTETVTQGDIGMKASVNRAELRTDTVSPTSANSTSADSQWPARNEGDEGKKIRRQQFTKLHRLLGVPVPAEFINPASHQKTDPHAWNTPDERLVSEPISPEIILSRADSPSEQSFMTFDEPSSGNRWSRLKSLHKRMGTGGGMAVYRGDP